MGMPRNAFERLALAIHRRDFDAAIAELHLLEATNPKWAIANQRARRAVSPPAPLPDCAPETLPAPQETGPTA
jgi:hypothetical protein